MNIKEARQSFEQLEVKVHGKDLTYLDNAATTLKPKMVVDSMSQHLLHEASNIHRGVHHFSELGTQKFEETRQKVAKFINSPKSEQVIFTKGTTESINLVANSFSQAFLKEGDEILLTGMEHHSNIIPWQLIADKMNLKIKVLPLTTKGELDLEKLDELLTPKVKIFSFVATSNSLGTINPFKELIKKAHAVGAKTLLDCAQWVAHFPTDVQRWDVDFIAFSGHKLYGPTGIGVLYGKEELLNQMPPYQGGGDMIESVSFAGSTFAPLPHKFEAGTPPIAEVIGLGAAIDFLSQFNWQDLHAHEENLTEYAVKELKKLPGLRLIGEAQNRVGVVSFVLDNVHPHDLGTFLDQEGVAIRTGHHCTQPIMEFFKIPATARASFALYNTLDEVDHLVKSLKKIQEFFA